MNTIRKRTALRLAKELQAEGWERVRQVGTPVGVWHALFDHPDYPYQHSIFDAAIIQRDAAELESRGWKVECCHSGTYFIHPLLGRHSAHEALFIQQQVDIENRRQMVVKALFFLLFAVLMAHTLWLIILIGG